MPFNFEKIIVLQKFRLKILNMLQKQLNNKVYYMLFSSTLTNKNGKWYVC